MFRIHLSFTHRLMLTYLPKSICMVLAWMLPPSPTRAHRFPFHFVTCLNRSVVFSNKMDVSAKLDRVSRNGGFYFSQEIQIFLVQLHPIKT